MLLLRWTIGPIANLGFEVLAEAVKNAKLLYPESRKVVCYNNLDDWKVKNLEKMGVELLDQTKENNYLKAARCLYVLVPGRIDINAHELFMDNDLVLTGKLPHIDEFLSCTDLFLATVGLYGLYGNYKEFVKPGIKINSGFFGIPPGFDLQKAAEAISMDLPAEDHFDFQGIVGAIISHKRHAIIGLDDIRICEPVNTFGAGRYGSHFIGANRNKHHSPWEKFINKNSIKMA